MMEDLLSSREENRHFDDGLDVTLSFKDVTCSAWLLMLKVCRKTKTAPGICSCRAMSRTLGIYLDLVSRTAWNGGYGALFELMNT